MNQSHIQFKPNLLIVQLSSSLIEMIEQLKYATTHGKKNLFLFSQSTKNYFLISLIRNSLLRTHDETYTRPDLKLNGRLTHIQNNNR